MVIYKVINVVNGKIYIGKTKQTLEKRKKSHLKKSRHKEIDKMTFFHRAIRKYGPENFHWDIIETLPNGTDEELCLRERYFIKQYDSNCREKGYNLTEGGDGVRRSGWKHHEETKEKIGNSNRGRHRTPEQKLKMRLATLKAMENWRPSPEQLERMRLRELGKKHSQETKRKQSENQIGLRLGWHHSEETKKKMSLTSPSSKMYKIISPTGEELIIKNLTAFCRENGLLGSVLSDVACGRRKSHKGWKVSHYNPE
jgi:group I intron endonuclease